MRKFFVFLGYTNLYVKVSIILFIRHISLNELVPKFVY